jgi:hypothetical protein
MKNKLQLFISGVIVTFLLTACGSSGGDGAPVAAPTKVIVKLASSGTLPANLPAGSKIGAIDTTVTYATNKGLSIADADIVVSDKALGTTIQPNVAVNGKVRIGILTGSSFDVGEFATLTFKIAPGNSPLTSDFNIDVTPGNTTTIIASDVLATDISAQLSVKILSVTFQ